MKDRKWLSLLLAVLLVLTLLSGCGGRGSADANPTETTENKPAQSQTNAADTTEKETTADIPTETTAETTVESTPETTTQTTPETTQPTTEPETQPPETNPPAPPQSFTPAPLTGALPESGKVDRSFFNDAVFVGDSVSLKLSYYEAAVDLLGSAQFLTAGSLGSGNALWEVSDESVHPVFQGEKMLLEESIPLTGAKKLYIMLGMNDIALYGIDASVSNMVTLIQRILSAVPDMTIYVQSMTPMTSTSSILSANGHNPQNVQKYNEKLLAACQSYGWYFVNVGEVMYDDSGYLRRDYCSDPDDMGIHFTNEGCGAWIEYLYTHTAG